MDEGDVDLQVLSLPSSGFEKISSDVATGVAQNANNELARLSGVTRLDLPGSPQ